MVIILGSGYLAKAYAKYFLINSIPYKMVTRKDLNYGNPNELSVLLTSTKASLVINAAGYTDESNIKDNKLICLYVNTILPGCIAEVCAPLNIPWIHLSSSSIYETIKNMDSGGWNEKDPNTMFSQTFNRITYNTTKIFAEELLQKYDNIFICRLGISFDNNENKRNYLTQLCLEGKTLSQYSNSLTNIDNFVEATYTLVTTKSPFGIYHITNPGIIKNDYIVEKLIEKGLKKIKPTYINNTPILLDNSKIMKIFPLPPIQESIDQALLEWTPAT